jgi:hypothetical protein
MKKKILLVAALAILAGLFAAPAAASASTPTKTFPTVWGKTAPHSAQVAACRGTHGDTFHLCQELATAPSFQCDIFGVGVISNVPNGPVIIKAIRDRQPSPTWAAAFRHAIDTWFTCRTHV